ncbi:MAG TPA: pitrilysin family protein [Steroidobacteraceae bacterium]|jgi:zinc protease|nr:pitrilysin family protein [Steroidobacteraceae bacterium]
MPTNLRLKALLLILAALAAPVCEAKKPKTPPPAPAATPVAAPAAPERITTVEGITEYRLPNGLRVLLFPDQTKQTITVNITYLVGSRYENYGETGMAHLLEHMVFKGSTGHKEIPNELSSHGARPNGTTSWDRTNYFETFGATEENLRWALDLEADRMVNSFIAQKDLDSEMTVVRNEFEGGENQPGSVMFKRLLSVAYDWHNYGNLPIGARSDIEGVPIERLQAFYRTYYQPDNALLLVAGKIDEAAVLALVQQYFGRIPRPTRVLPEMHTVEPTQDGERRVALRREGDVSMAASGYHVPSGVHEDFAALEILGQILADAPAGRLHKELVEKGKAAAVFPAALMLAQPGMFGFGVQVRVEQSVDAALEQLLALVEKPAAKPVTDAEVERARTQILASIDLSLNSSENVGLSLSDWAGMGDWRLMFLNRDRLRAVKTADVQRVWASYFKPSNRTVAVFYPTKAPDRVEVPKAPEVLALLKDYKGDAAKDAGVAFDATPENIEAHTRRTTLPGGLQLVLLPKKTRGGGVYAGLALRFGDVASLKNLGSTPAFATGMLMRGTTSHTRQQLADEFDRLKARVNVNSWGSGMYLFAETTRENLPAVLTLVGEVLREPAFDPKEIEQLRNEWLAGIEQQRSDPSALAFNQFQRYLKPYPRGDIRYVETLDESIASVKAVSREQMQRFHKDFFGAQPAQVSVVGDFDAAAVEQQFGSLLGGWKNPKPFTRVPTDYFDVPAKDVVIETPDKAQAFFVAGMNLALRDDDPDYPALVLGNYILGASGLNSRLTGRIRGKDGLSYGVGSQLSGDNFDKAGMFFTYAIYAPQNLAKLQQAFNEEIARALAEDFTQDEIDKAKSGWLQSRGVARAQDNELAGALGHWLFVGRTLAWDADFEKKVMALDAAQIRAALKRHLVPAKFTVIKAGDFAGAAAKAAVAPLPPTAPVVK